jgi:AraC family transcriptional regulator
MSSVFDEARIRPAAWALASAWHPVSVALSCSRMQSQVARGQFYGRALTRRRIGDLLLIDSRHLAGSRLSRHSHETAYFCLNHGVGTYEEEYGRRRRSCRPGMLVVHPPGEVHSQNHLGAVASLNVEVGPAWLRRVTELEGPLDQPTEFRGCEIGAAGFQLFREFRNADQDSPLAIESLCWEILVASLDNRDQAAGVGRPRWLVEARDLLDAGIREPLTLKGIAREAGVHPVHFAATFRRFYGCSVGEYLRRRRLRYARRKLAVLELPLAQIAIDAGFADQSHLTRTFKRFTGMTPGRYRTFLRFKTR